MIDSKLLPDQELLELYDEPLSEEEVEAMHDADEISSLWLAISFSVIPDLIIEK